MKLFELLKRESTGLGNEIFIATAISGFANAGILAVINKASQSGGGSIANFRYLMLFGVVFLLYIYCLRYTFHRTSLIYEKVIHNIRNRLVGKIRGSNLRVIEHIGWGEIYNRLIKETLVISQSQSTLITAFQSSLMVVFVTLYIALLSVHAFLLIVGLMVVGALIYLGMDRDAQRTIQVSREKEIEFVDGVRHLLDGFKEVRVNSFRSDDLNRDISHISLELMNAKVITTRKYNDNYIFSQAAFYFIIAVMVFVLPQFSMASSNMITEITAAILFVVGPLTNLVGAVPILAQANISAVNIYKLEEQLDRGHADFGNHMDSDCPPFEDFSQITFERVEFSYPNDGRNGGFRVGPLDLTIQKGEVLFVIGGNGSGKSTIMKLLTALYPPDYGTIRLDDTTITPDNVQRYREMFSIIFTDFHLFEKLYGIKSVQQEDVNALLKLLVLDKKTRLENERFSHLDLSTGQRKRLALLVTLLEKNPIYVFDEWAADQDPDFRKFFYEEILKNLKKQGKTIIAATHDDKYFHIADRVVKMDYGNFIPYQPSSEPSSAQERDASSASG